MGWAGGVRLVAADLGHQPDHAGGGRHPVPVGRAAGDLPAELHPGLRRRPRYSRHAYLVVFFLLAFLTIWILRDCRRSACDPDRHLLSAAVRVRHDCHCELYGLRPASRWLPAFYLMVAAGGRWAGSSSTWWRPSCSRPASGNCSGRCSPPGRCSRVVMQRSAGARVGDGGARAGASLPRGPAGCGRPSWSTPSCS